MKLRYFSPPPFFLNSIYIYLFLSSTQDFEGVNWFKTNEQRLMMIIQDRRRCWKKNVVYSKDSRLSIMLFLKSWELIKNLIGFLHGKLNMRKTFSNIVRKIIFQFIANIYKIQPFCYFPLFVIFLVTRTSAPYTHLVLLPAGGFIREPILSSWGHKDSKKV